MLLENPVDVPETKPENYSAIPEGHYTVIITEFRERTVSGPKLSGRVFDAILQIVEGVYHGSTLNVFLPLLADQANQRAWGHKTLASIAWACGLGGRQITDTSQIENLPFVVRVEQREETFIDKHGEEKTSVRNEVKDYIDQKAWLKQKQADSSKSESKAGYQRADKKKPDPEEQPSGYAAGKRARKPAPKTMLKIEMIHDLADPRLADYPFEIEPGKCQFWIDETQAIWELQPDDLKHFVRYMWTDDMKEEDQPLEVRKPVTDFEIVK